MPLTRTTTGSGTLDPEAESNAYVEVLQYLSHTLKGSDRSALTAFITLKVSLKAASVVKVATALMVSQDPHDYLLRRDIVPGGRTAISYSWRCARTSASSRRWDELEGDRRRAGWR